MGEYFRGIHWLMEFFRESDPFRKRLLMKPAGICLIPLVLATLAVAAPDTDETPRADGVHAYDLVPGVRALVEEDGRVELQLESSGITHVLLRVALAESGSLRGEQTAVCTGVYTEGVEGGLRGFAREADDDGDGLVDEDRADGLDNDGDGRTDEDFAAVSDAMAVVSRMVAGRRHHLETYHWSYSHLRPSLALSYSHTDGAGQVHDGAVSLSLSSGTWYQAALSLGNPGTATSAGTGGGFRQDVIYVAYFRNPADAASRLWLGAYPLSRGGKGQPAGAQRRVRIQRGTLNAPLHEGVTELAISVAPTLLQLRSNLAQMRAVHRGVPDLAGQGRVPWIVPPSSLSYRSTTEPEVRWAPIDTNGFRLVFHVTAGDNAVFDPDRFTLDGQPLGSPTAIVWRSHDQEDATEFNQPWSAWKAADLEKLTDLQQDPFQHCPELRTYAGKGDLIFEFATRPHPAVGSERSMLVGQTVCGRAIQAELEPWVVGGSAETGEEADAQARGSESQQLQAQWETMRQIPTLNPELLENFPNPFRDQTTISFRIPETIEEGLVWEKGPQPGVAPDSPMPYLSGQPAVNLNIYSLGGKEVATLFSGLLSTGEYFASWDGTDSWGRTVASGTYFCKLQIENWSVTKRLIFVR